MADTRARFETEIEVMSFHYPNPESVKLDRMYDAPDMSAPKGGRTVFEFHGFRLM